MRSTPVALAVVILGATQAAAQYSDGQFEPGTSQWQSLPEDDGSYSEPPPEPEGRDFLCPTAGCVHVLWIIPCSMLVFTWIVSAVSVIPDWRRQEQYVRAVREAMQLHPVPCHVNDVPPSGTWMWKSGVWQQQLDLVFTEHGTFSGSARSREGHFLVQGGRFNIETGEFVWEEVIPDVRRGCSSALWRFMWPILMGPYTVFSPIERHRLNDVRRMLSAPRTIVRAKGEEDDAGQWTLGGTYTSYDRRRRTVLSGRVYDLATGKTSSLQVEEVSVRSPVGSPKSLRHSPGFSPTVSPKARLQGDMLDPWANEAVDIDNEEAISLDLSPKSGRGNNFLSPPLSPGFGNSPVSPNGRRRSPNPSAALVAAGLVLPIRATSDNYSDVGVDLPPPPPMYFEDGGSMHHGGNDDASPLSPLSPNASPNSRKRRTGMALRTTFGKADDADA